MQDATAELTFAEASNTFDLKELGVPNHFFTIKIIRQAYLGKKAIAVYMSQATQKLKAKLHHLRLQEKRQEMVQAESYKSTINHELRSPLESIELILELILDKIKVTNPFQAQEQFSLHEHIE